MNQIVHEMYTILCYYYVVVSILASKKRDHASLLIIFGCVLMRNYVFYW